GKTAFETRYGFARNQVQLGNWRESPFSRWSFQNVGELVPSAAVAAASSGSEAPAQDLDGLLGEKVALAGG
ncbi:MAG: 6-aminohexanoate hydrolase, partial [Mesorhizobium sp.]